MKVAVMIQARMGSTRLPGKVLADLAGEPMLARVVVRASRSGTASRLVVVTSTSAGDDVIETICAQRGWACFRGSEEDVLDRYRQAAVHFSADVIVRITADCPLIDPEIIDRVLEEFLREGTIDYASNVLAPRTFPRGLDVEVIGRSALERAWREDSSPASREHVTPYLYRHPEMFRLRRVANDEDLSSQRWTVDTAEDMTLAGQIYTAMGHDSFSWRDVVGLLRRHPEWLDINRHVKQKEVT
jgi:spore coat polysaccharide biosynthesis protein SpsF